MTPDDFEAVCRLTPERHHPTPENLRRDWDHLGLRGLVQIDETGICAACGWIDGRTWYGAAVRSIDWLCYGEFFVAAPLIKCAVGIGPREVRHEVTVPEDGPDAYLVWLLTLYGFRSRGRRMASPNHQVELFVFRRPLFAGLVNRWLGWLWQ